MDRGACWATAHGVAEWDMTEVTQHACTQETPHVLLLLSLLACRDWWRGEGRRSVGQVLLMGLPHVQS